MRLSRVLFASLREPPSDAASDAERLLVRAGLLRRGDGWRAWLPLGALALRRLEAVVRDALDPLAIDDATVPLATGASPGRAGAGRTACPADDRLPDAAPFAAVFGSAIRSYRQLPAGLRAIRVAPRLSGREPLLGADERLVTDIAVAARDADDLTGLLGRLEAVLADALAPAIAVVPADWSVPGGTGRALTFAHPAGDEALLACAECGYAAERDVARVARAAPEPEPALPRAEVETPGATTIASLAAFLGVGPERCAKAAFFEADDGRLITAVVRGDHEVSEPKLAGVAGAACLRPASPERIRAAGMEPGYGSPVGAHDTLVVVDEVCAASPNLVAGANRPGWHLRNVNVGRDVVPDAVADIARAADGDACSRCGGPLDASEAIALVVLGPAADPAAVPAYLAADGVARQLAIGFARVEIERIVAAAVETRRDERGIVWPRALAPLPVHLVTLAADRDASVESVAETLEAAARGAGNELLWDDRVESPGVKFADADLIGLPVRLTVSPRSLASGGVEVVARAGNERQVVAVEEALAIVRAPGEAPDAGELSNNR